MPVSVKTVLDDACKSLSSETHFQELHTTTDPQIKSSGERSCVYHATKGLNRPMLRRMLGVVGAFRGNVAITIEPAQREGASGWDVRVTAYAEARPLPATRGAEIPVQWIEAMQQVFRTAFVPERVQQVLDGLARLNVPTSTTLAVQNDEASGLVRLSLPIPAERFPLSVTALAPINDDKVTARIDFPADVRGIRLSLDARAVRALSLSSAAGTAAAGAATSNSSSAFAVAAAGSGAGGPVVPGQTGAPRSFAERIRAFARGLFE